MTRLTVTPKTEQQISDAVADFLLAKEASNRRPRTLDFYRHNLSEFASWLAEQGVQKLEEVNRRSVQGFLIHARERGLADATVHGKARAIKAWLRFLEREEWIDRAPRFEMPRVEEKRPEVLTPEDVQTVIDACLSLRDECIVLMLADTGLRASELLSLDWGDVNLEQGQAVVRRTKNRKWRTVPLGVHLRRLSLKYRQEVPSNPKDPLWPSQRGGRLTYWGSRQVFRRLSKRSGVDVGAHDHRRFFATWSIRNGMGLFAVQSVLGHSSLTMVRKYAEIAQSDLKRRHDRAGPVDHLLG